MRSVQVLMVFEIHNISLKNIKRKFQGSAVIRTVLKRTVFLQRNLVTDSIWYKLEWIFGRCTLTELMFMFFKEFFEQLVEFFKRLHISKYLFVYKRIWTFLCSFMDKRLLQVKIKTFIVLWRQHLIELIPSLKGIFLQISLVQYFPIVHQESDIIKDEIQVPECRLYWFHFIIKPNSFRILHKRNSLFLGIFDVLEQTLIINVRTDRQIADYILRIILKENQFDSERRFFRIGNIKQQFIWI